MRQEPGQAPVGAQDAQQLSRQHDGAVLAALAVLDPDHHPHAVDVADLQADRLGRPQTRRRGRRQRGTGLQARHRLEKAHHFIGVQHHRQLARRARIGDALRDLTVPECDAVEEPQGTDRLVQRRPRNAGRHQMNLKGADVLQTKPVRRPAEVPAELTDRVQIGSLRRRRQITDGHVLGHPPAQRAQRNHRRGSCLQDWTSTAAILSDGALPSNRSPHSRDSGFVQSLPSEKPKSPQNLAVARP